MSDKKDNFHDLKRLLKLKRHEIPPPGYFNGFSGDVISRLRAGEEGGQETLAERMASGSLWTHLFQTFRFRSGVIGGLATSMCLVLMFGVVMIDRSEPGAMGLAAADSDNSNTATLATTVPLAPPDPNSGIAVSSNSVVSLQPVPGLFGSQQNPLFQQASFATQQ